MKIQVLFLSLMLALGARAQTVEEMVMTSTDADTCRGRWCSGQVEITQWDNYKVSIRIRRGGSDGEGTAGNATATVTEAAATVRGKARVELYAGTDSLLVWQTRKWEVTKDGTLADKAKGKFADIGGAEGIMSTWALLDYLRTGKWYARIGDSWVKISRMVTD